MAVIIPEQTSKMSRGAGSADALVAEVQQLRQKVAELEQKLQLAKRDITELTQIVGANAVALMKITDHIHVEFRSIKIKHGYEVVIESPRVEITGGGLGCNLRINSNNFDVFSVHTRFDVDFMSANTIKTTLSAQSDLAMTSSNGKWASSQIKLETGRAEVAGLMKCDTMQANNVVGRSYTPGAGNVW